MHKRRPQKPPETTTRSPDRCLLAFPFDEQAITPIANELGATPRKAAYSVRGAPVYELTLVNQQLHTPVTVILWPSIKRVDVRLADVSVVYKDVERVEIYPGIEVSFRRGPGSYLFVTRSGSFSTAS